MTSASKLHPTGAPPEFSFPVHDLDAGGRHFRRPIRAAWLRGTLEGTDVGATEHDGDLDLRLSKSGTDVVVRGTLSADLTVECARCLERIIVPIREELSALAVPAAATRQVAADGEDGAELAVEDADVIEYVGDAIVLDELVRDELLLGIPMIPLCSESCPGISRELSEPAAEPSIDPRLLPLLDLKQKS